MSFSIDEQTLRDLSIFEGEAQGFSWMKFFAKSDTLQGRHLLSKWLKNPTSEIATIQARHAAIEFFASNEIKLQIDHNEVDLIMHYLDSEQAKLRNNVIDASISWMKNWIAPNQAYYMIKLGIGLLLKLFRQIEIFLDDCKRTNRSKRISEICAQLKTCLVLLNLPDLTEKNGRRKLNFYEIASLDSCFRGKNKQVVMNLLDLCYEIDALSTLSKWIGNGDFCLPTFSSSSSTAVGIEQLVHPAIPGAVRNSFTMTWDQNLVFLSGSNMAGKSSFLKTLGVCIYLAHCGFPIPAKKMHTTVFKGLVTTINLADAIDQGLSHHYGEVLRVKKIANMLIKQSGIFVILDELFKGTNAQDAEDASLLTLQGFNKIKHSLFVISSHITSLAKQLAVEQVDLRYMEHVVVNGAPKFTYLLKEGLSTDGTGMYFVEKEKIAELLALAANSPIIKSD